MRIVVIESPFAGDVEKNLRYLRACMRDSLKRGEAPYASHALYTQPGVLDDGNPEDRKLGMQAGFAFKQFADASIVYTDLGITPGMQAGIDATAKMARTRYGDGDERTCIEYRKLGCDWESAAWEVEDEFATKWPKTITDEDKIELIEKVFRVITEGKNFEDDLTECAVTMLEHVEALA